MAVTWIDTFTRGGGEVTPFPIESHAGELTTWTLDQGTAASYKLTETTTYSNNVSRSYFRSSVTPANVNHVAVARFLVQSTTVPGTSFNTGVGIRVVPTTWTGGYIGRLSVNNSGVLSVDILRVTGSGAPAASATLATTGLYTVGASYDLYFDAQGSGATTYLAASLQRVSDGQWLTSDGSTFSVARQPCLIYTDTSPLSVANQALIIYGQGLGSSTTYIHIDQVGYDLTATDITLSGPSTCTVGSPSGNFTVGVVGGVLTQNVTITPSDNSGGGSFTPTSVTLTPVTTTATFTYTAASAGAKTISLTNNRALANPSNATITASSGGATLSLVAPTSASVGIASASFSVTLSNGSGSVIVTPNDGGNGGTFNPTSVTLTPGSPTGTFTYTATKSGAIPINLTNNSGLTNPTAITNAAGIIAINYDTNPPYLGTFGGQKVPASPLYCGGVGGTIRTQDVSIPSPTENVNLSGRVYAPDANLMFCPVPLVVVMTGGGATLDTIAWAAQFLAANGYVVVTPLPNLLGDPASFNAAAKAGIDFGLSNSNPYRSSVNPQFIGACGYSLGCRSLVRTQNEDSRIKAVVGWDNWAVRATGDEGSPACSFSGTEFVTPKVPVLSMASDSCDTSVIGVDRKKVAFNWWKQNRMPCVQLVFNGWTHLDWTESGPVARHDVSNYYTLAWLDRWLKNDSTAMNRVLATSFTTPSGTVNRSSLLSTVFRSAIFADGREIEDFLNA
ncbi:MAG: hypothetical protein KatS3mg087_0532 [Patescibacteria group bacterium]|nr:MAG: hypothetical protein KatS3mg087_0532 [Patescibacteria group bacterium]